jgi:hypothetical protein
VDTISCGIWKNNLDQAASIYPGAGAFLPRTGWIASASLMNSSANLSLDGDETTRWSTFTTHQAPGQWFIVDMRQPTTFTGIYLDAGDPSYLPIGYQVYVSSDSTSWSLVASGSAKNEIVFNSNQTARYIKVIQTGTSSSVSWRMAEFYVMYTGSSDGPGTGLPDTKYNNNITAYISGNKLTLKGTTGNSKVSVYNVSGQLVVAPTVVGSKLDFSFRQGMYIVIVENDEKIYRQKILVK